MTIIQIEHGKTVDLAPADQAAEAAREQGGLVTELVVLLDREQGGRECLLASNILAHVVFSISEAFEWLNEVDLLNNEDHKMIMEYIEKEKNNVLSCA